MENADNNKLIDVITEILSDVSIPIIYFIRCNEFVKIGTSSGNFWGRLHDLQVGNPYKLEIDYFMLGGHEIERKIHKEAKIFWIRGEWYLMTHQQVLDLVKKLTW